MTLRTIIRFFGSALFIVAMASWVTPTVFAATEAGSCVTNAESRQFDYFVGDWSVSAPGSSGKATSKVSLSLDKCLVIESWDGGRGHTGQNTFAYSPEDKSWYGMFADNQGRVHVFAGGKVSDGTAEFQGSSRGSDGGTALNRVRVIRVSANKVEEIWEKSTDNGANWKAVFRGEYVRE
jgi:hypothetical protein